MMRMLVSASLLMRGAVGIDFDTDIVADSALVAGRTALLGLVKLVLGTVMMHSPEKKEKQSMWGVEQS